MSKTKLQIQLYGSQILAKKCTKVIEINQDITDAFDGMLELMREENGIGLAANQAGLTQRLVVIELPDAIFRMINPEIVEKKGRASIEEGCLSFPGVILNVPRAEHVAVKYTEENGDEMLLEADGLLGIALQHEIDHINGITFNKRVSFKEQFKIRKKLTDIKNKWQKK